MTLTSQLLASVRLAERFGPGVFRFWFARAANDNGERR